MRLSVGGRKKRLAATLTFALVARPDSSGWEVLDDGIFLRLAKVKLTVSVGACSYPSDGETADDLLAAATRHMQRDRQSRGHAHAPANAVISLDAYR